MALQRSSLGEAGSNMLLRTGVAVVVVIVLVMGITLMRRQAQPQEPQVVILPTLEAPQIPAPPAVTSAATQAVISATPLPPASSATKPLVDIPKPRIVQPHTSESAVARAPQRIVAKPDAVEHETPPEVTR